MNSRISLTRMVFNSFAPLSGCMPLSSVVLFGAALFLASLLWFGSAFTLIWGTHLLVSRLKRDDTLAPVPAAAPTPFQAEDRASIMDPAPPDHQHSCCLPNVNNGRRTLIQSDDGSGSEDEDGFGFLEERRTFRYYNRHEARIARSRRDAGRAGYGVSVSVGPR